MVSLQRIEGAPCGGGLSEDIYSRNQYIVCAVEVEQIFLSSERKPLPRVQKPLKIDVEVWPRRSTVKNKQIGSG